MKIEVNIEQSRKTGLCINVPELRSEAKYEEFRLFYDIRLEGHADLAITESHLNRIKSKWPLVADEYARRISFFV